MDDLYQVDVERFGPMGGPREYGTSEGRMNGGGFINGPVAASDFDGKGIWAQPSEADPQGPSNDVPRGMGAYGERKIYSMVEGWAGNTERWF